jgi:hypothetical protein
VKLHVRAFDQWQQPRLRFFQWFSRSPIQIADSAADNPTVLQFVECGLNHGDPSFVVP